MHLKEQAKNYFKELQEKICVEIAGFDKKSYQKDVWTRAAGGGGETRIFQEGKFLEKGGVNFSEVYGEFSEEFAKTIPQGEGLKFYATGISLVLHPINPHVPTVHANFRYLERGSASWLGGGMDLTPYYPIHQDVVHFHQTLKTSLDSVGAGLYEEHKKHCDSYFYLPHRKETRGVGGIFFDYQFTSNAVAWPMQKAAAEAFIPAYFPLVKKNIDTPFTLEQKNFQEWRRGRYVEFNLLYDRGTVFGLKTDGRVESILMSLPKHVQWWYNYEIPAGSEESKIKDFLRPRDWLNE